MNGPEHYREAERLLDLADRNVSDNWAVTTGEYKADVLAAAQVHATLALAAATQTRQGFTLTDDDVMRCAHGAVICGICGYGAPMGGRS